MLPLDIIRQDKEKVIAGLKKRNFSKAAELIDQVLLLDQKKRKLQQENDSILTQINLLSRKVGTLIQQGDTEEVNTLKSRTKTLKKSTATLTHELMQVSHELKEVLYLIPNVPDESVPPGSGANHNVLICESGEIPNIKKGDDPHWELVKKYDIIDFDRGAKISGAGFPIYKGKGAKLQRALVSFFLDKAIENGYQEVQPPLLINERSGYGTGQLPDKEGQMYHIEKDNLYLIPTAEVPITNMYRDTVLNEKALPIKNVGYTPCFRREAGSWGSHVRGLNRLHQFDKVEIVQLSSPENSMQALGEMCDYVQQLLTLLGLQYRKMMLCGGDLGFSAMITYDLEVYASAQKKWLEVSSVSNFGVFQANRLKLRCKNNFQKTILLHTLNGSALALPRVLAALIENYQTEKGIQIPELLVPYTGFDVID